MPTVDLFAKYGIKPQPDDNSAFDADKIYKWQAGSAREQARRSMTSVSMSSLVEKGGQSYRSPGVDTQTQNGRPGNNARVVIVVPRVKRKREYVSFEDEYYVKEVIRRLGDWNGQRWYEVRLGDDDTVQVTHTRLLARQNGRLALRRFGRTSSLPTDKRDHHTSKPLPPVPDDSDEMSLSHGRQQRAKRRQDPGFVDSSKLTLSSDDDEVEPHQERRSSRQKASRKSGEQPPKRRKRTRTASESNPDDEVITSRRSSNRQVSRATRSMRSGSHIQLSYSKNAVKNIENESDDEEDETVDRNRSSSNESFSGNKPLSKADTARFKRRKISQASAEDEPAQATRRSGRVGRVTHSMRERGEEEIFALEEPEAPAPSRIVAVSEVFKQLPRKNEFRLVHSQVCIACDEYGNSRDKGPLVFCQGCICTYHKSCLGPRTGRHHLVTKIGDGDFVLQCHRCVGVMKKREPTAPSHDICQACKESGPACAPFRERKSPKQEEKEREENGGQDPITEVNGELINNVHNVLFRCVTCKRGFHFHHLPARTSDHNIIDDGADISDIRYMQYCKDWTCLDCCSKPGKVQALVAWRPTDLEAYTPGNTAEMVNEDEKEYLVKWEKRSYFQAAWMPGAWVWGVAAYAMRKAFARRDNGYNLPTMTAEDAIPEEYLRVDIVLDVQFTSLVSIRTEEIDKARVQEVEKAMVKYKGLPYEEVVWEKAPSPEDGERWTDFVAAYADWVLGRYVHLPKQHYLKERLEKVRSMNFEQRLLKKKQPDTLVGGKLMEYQLEGLNWLLYKWYQGQNAILADEMGLGKTIQIIGLLATLVQDHKCWPFLIVVPNSTCPNWRREIKSWAPSLRVVAYYGSSEARKLAMQHELYPQGNKDLKCHIVVTSYEVPVDDNGRRFLREVPWAGLIVDEGQRLKNDKSLLYDALNALKAPFRVLLTGTPLQNNARELFNLLQFLDKKFNANQLEEHYSELTPQKVSELHELIRPFFLRRTKAQVLTFLPPMAQIIVPVTMTVLQKKLYKSILAKNPELIKAIFKKEKSTLKQAERSNLNNLLMQLRKCLCHPFVYSKLIEERSANAAVSHRSLVEASSKLQLLEIMLPQLKERGHRVLIFSQFLEMLDVIEDFLDGLELPFQRLDGTIGTLQKQKRIDAFNAPESPYFAFLLSTRAGGVGINLASADTVIIMDPDFNPHQDIQALSRAHRIGQKKKVLVFQLMTRDSAEEKIIQIGRKKMALDHVLIDKMDADDDAGLDLQSILQHGTAALFEDDDARDIHYDATSVEKLLDRSQAENTKTGEDNSAESQFSFARVWANDRNDLEEGLHDSDTEQQQRTPDPTIWDKLLKERERDAAKQRAALQETFGRGKRKRRAVDYTKESHGLMDDMSPFKKGEETGGSDTDFRERPDGDDETEEDEGVNDGTDQVSPDELAGPRDRGVSGIAATVTPVPIPGVGGLTGGNTPTPTLSSLTAAAKAQPKQKQPTNPSFKRAQTSTTARHPTPSTDQSNLGKLINAVSNPCPACFGSHIPGQCPLRLAGTENCPLCGIAHYGMGRTCPHLKSETQVRAMMDAIKHSPEEQSIKDAALTYLRGVKGGLVRAKKKKEEEDKALLSRLNHDDVMEVEDVDLGKDAD
ncbi:MAG: hypothetical protein M1816_006936 [Peltula sp. TS41687]|nr:MAG: hypothetical protein M1816_006936 [Peltula sp. TS41687]